MDNDKALIKRLFKEYILPNKYEFLASLLLGAIAGAMAGASAWIFKDVIDEIFIAKDSSKILIIAGVILLIYVLKGASTYGQQVIASILGSKVVADVQRRLADAYFKQSMAFFITNRSGDLMARFQNDTGQIRRSIFDLVRGSRDLFSLIALLAVMITMNPVFSLVSLILIPIGAIPISKLSKKMKELSTSFNQEGGVILTVLGQIIQNMRIVQAFNQQQQETQNLDRAIKKIYDISVTREKLLNLTSPLMETIGGASMAVVIIFGGWQITQEKIVPGEFFAFIMAFFAAYEPLKRLSKIHVGIQIGLTATQRVFKMIDQDSTIVDIPDAEDLLVTEGDIKFSNISFSYDATNAKNKVKTIHDMNIYVPANKTVALVGLSGGGKSTVINLLMRYWDVNSGEILIDGQNISKVSLVSLRDALAFVNQDVLLFDDTVSANIGYGKHGSTHEDIVNAAKSAAAHDFIMELPKQYETIIGEKGIMLSGGQKQRLSIARAIIKGAPILLLDEATSALDSESERAIQATLDNLMAERTTLVIAHRLSTVINADYIYVIEGGEIKEEGTHEQLIEQSGAYKRLYDLQFKS